MQRKKNFDCGHRGFGKYCHFCPQIEKEKEEVVKDETRE